MIVKGLNISKDVVYQSEVRQRKWVRVLTYQLVLNESLWLVKGVVCDQDIVISNDRFTVGIRH